MENEDLFAKIARRQALWRRMIELEEAQKDPNRLKKARGTQLLDEERDKKRINKVPALRGVRDALRWPKWPLVLVPLVRRTELIN